MDREDRRRFFVVGSVVLEVVTPLFRKRLEDDYRSRGLGSLQAFLNSQPVVHVLFHLRHRNVWCCADQSNCVNNSTLPLNYNQWDMLYTEKPGPNQHLCHCKFAANEVQLKDLDSTLASLILLNCCNLGPRERMLISTLQQFQDDYLSHNTTCCITEVEYDTMWTDMTSYILQLDKSKEDDLIRIETRPLDEPLCMKYTLFLLGIIDQLDEIDTALQTILHLARRGRTCPCSTTQGRSQQREPYRLGQQIFNLHQQIDLASVFLGKWILGIPDGVLMDDGRLVLCLHSLNSLLICNTNGTMVDSIPLQDKPCGVTAVNSSTVAVIFKDKNFIHLYDIDMKINLKSIEGPEGCCDITNINDKLVAGGYKSLQIIDPLTEEIIRTINIDELLPYYLHASGDRIFFCGGNTNKNLYCYNYSGEKVFMTELPVRPTRITSLGDGSLYVIWNGSVQHVSSDGKYHNEVTTEGMKSLGEHTGVIHYNAKQRKLIIVNNPIILNVYHEIS